MKFQKPLGIKILEEEVEKEVAVIKEKIKENPEVLKSKVIMLVPGLIAAKALLKLFSEMGKYKNK